MTYQILLGNNLDVLPTLPDNSVDSIVTDPPYELGFMGKKWDSSGIAYSVELWQQCLRVLKPGGYLLSFGGTRTYHRMVVSIEDAGFEIRDMISWISNKTFPKSLNIGKAIDKAAGVEREVIGQRTDGMSETAMKPDKGWNANSMTNVIDITMPATDEAKQWDGWGTGLKPTVEPIVMARKPVEGTVANNVLTYGTGGLNIDGSRVGYASDYDKKHQEDIRKGLGTFFGGNGQAKSEQVSMQGRWPANLIIDQDTAELLDEQTSHLHAAGNKKDTADGLDNGYNSSSFEMSYKGRAKRTHNDSGGASRFFYVAKASKRDRNEGLDDLEAKTASEMTGRKEGSAGLVMKHEDGSDKANAYAGTTGAARQNFHPTVKPTSLMEYLVKLVTPPGGVVLDPFTGSGSTGKAAILQGFDFIGIELTEEYLPIIQGRLKYAEQLVAEAEEQEKLKETEKLF
jgi:site-specific DNA-methyltransferase (adenine-specific)